MRYEYNSTAVDIQGLWRSISFDVRSNGLPTLVPNIGTPYRFYKPQGTIFMPRLGLAYRATENWVFRLGIGTYYNVHQLNNYTILNLNPPKSGTSTFVQTANSSGRLNPNQTILTFTSPFGVVNPTLPTGITALNPDNTQPYINQWSLDIQRRLPFDTVLTVGYVGNKGTHIDNTVELNAPLPGLSSNPVPVNSRRPIPVFADGPGGPTRGLNRLRWLTSDANSWYHALQVAAQKRFSGGLQLSLAYTYSKALGEGYGRNEGGGAIPNTYQNPRNRAAEKTRYGFDFRHSAVVSFLYELPTPGSLNQGVGKFVLGGWQINSIVQLRSGLPFTVQQSSTLNTVEGHVRPDRLSTGKLDNPTVNKWFDPDAFRVVTCQRDDLAARCHYGNAGHGILEGPGFKNVDFSLLKNFSITEKLRLQFRAEIFNLFNTPQFSVPNSTLNATNTFLPPVGGTAYPSQAGIQGGPGAITGIIAPMRQMQFGLKLLF